MNCEVKKADSKFYLCRKAYGLKMERDKIPYFRKNYVLKILQIDQILVRHAMGESHYTS